MNSLYRYLSKTAGYLVFLIMIFSGLGMDSDSALAKSASNANEGGKITMYNLATDSPNKQLQPVGKISVQQPPSAKIQLQYTLSKRTQQSASAKTRMHRSENKIERQPVAKHQSSDIAVPINDPPIPDVEKINETSEIQKPVISEQLLPADPTPLLTEARTQPFNDDKLPSISKMDNVIHTASKLTPESAPQQDSIHDTVGIIARLLLKFSLITVCCIALFFSFSALQIAKSNQRMHYRIGEENITR